MISTHILNTATGAPMPHIPVSLAMQRGAAWEEISHSKTDGDGRAKGLGSEEMRAGVYRLTFEVHTAFYPRIEIVFALDDPEKPCHVPLLLSEYGYTTYRGS